MIETLKDKAHSEQSWHLLGPVTRFQSRSEKVEYEIAQVTIVVENQSPESDDINIDGIIVYAQEKARRHLGGANKANDWARQETSSGTSPLAVWFLQLFHLMHHPLRSSSQD